VVIYLHGNAVDLGSISHLLGVLRLKLGAHVIGVEYPGFGAAEGEPTEESVNRACESVYDFMMQQGWSEEQILVFGRSVGTGPAIRLAAKRHPGYLVALSPYTSIRDVARQWVSVAAYLQVNRWNNKEVIGNVRCPTLFIHGRKDDLVPCSHSQTLYDACVASAMRQLVVEEDMDHNQVLLIDYSTPYVHHIRTWTTIRYY
jgi:pimeloyl-ACP methyl ester carboxylesterase